MKKKKLLFKTIMFIVFLLVFIWLVAGTCKRKVKALENAFYGNIYEISSRELSQTGISLMICPIPWNSGSYRVAYIDAPARPGFIYLDLTYNNGLESTLWVNYYDGTNYYTIDSCYLYSPYILFTILPDAQSGELYLYVDYLELETITTGQNEVDFWEYTRAYTLDLEDYGFIQDYYDSYLTFEYSVGTSELKGLIQSYYLEAGTIMNQVYNLYGDSVNLNYYTYWLQYGYQNGYDIGFDAGEDAGEDAGYIAGYNVGYTDGQNAENATPLVFAVLTGVFETIGAFLSIEVLPHIPIGLFFALPLFFAVVGLILWIWRRN